MKKFFSVFMIAVCCMALAMPAQAQLIKFGVKGGVNLSKLKFEGMKDNSTGFFFGPMAEITIPVIGLGVDGALLYSQKGDKMEGLDMKQSGLDIPVNLKYSIGLGSMLGIYVAGFPGRNRLRERGTVSEVERLQRSHRTPGLGLYGTLCSVRRIHGIYGKRQDLCKFQYRYRLHRRDHVRV